MCPFIGPQCDVDVDECASDPCQNRGKCIDGIDRYLCLCPVGFVGLHCEINMDECMSAPCLHGRYWAPGHVRELKNSLHPQGKTLKCHSSTSKAHLIDFDPFSCADGIFSYSCLCEPGWTGGRCETNIDVSWALLIKRLRQTEKMNDWKNV